MFDRLDDLLIRYEELMEELNNPYVVEETYEGAGGSGSDCRGI